jgi:membrane-associated protease RseP (regulator of RpoE activity)
MSETTPTFPVLAADRSPQVWFIPRPRTRWWLYVLFLLLTMFSTTVVGAGLEFNFLHRQPMFSLEDNAVSVFPVEWAVAQPANLLLGLPFSLTLMLILFAHEMGHYLYARHYRVYVTPPFFVPFPSLIGTLGAFIRIKSPIPSRAALFDIGIAGPIAGFIPACIALFVGLSMSRPMPMPKGSYLELGFPLIFQLAAHLIKIGSPLSSVALHPVAVAAWVGMFATSLNLLPGGQLDGGHIVFSVSPRLHWWTSVLTVVALIPLGRYLWYGWFLWAVILALTWRHPNVPRYPSVSGGRRWIAVFGLLMLLLTFTRVPVAQRPDQPYSWRQFRNDAHDDYYQLRDKVRRKLHRN